MHMAELISNNTERDSNSVQNDQGRVMKCHIVLPKEGNRTLKRRI